MTIQKTSFEKSLTAITGGLVSFVFFTLFSHPESPVHKKIPKVRTKRISITPHLKVHRRNKTYHVHHWIYLPSLYVMCFFLRKKLLKSFLFNGFIIGGIVQGLLYKDRLKLIRKKAS